MRSTGSPTTLSGTRWPPAKPGGRPGWSNGTWRRGCSAVRGDAAPLAFHAVGGFGPCPVEPLLTDAERAYAASGHEPHQPSSGRVMSVLANVPASMAFLHAELARLRSDATRAVSCDQRAMTHLGEEDWLLRSQIAWNLAVADWLC